MSTPTRCLPERQWVREAGSAQGKPGAILTKRAYQ
jgi:hypothetical protein